MLTRPWRLCSNVHAAVSGVRSEARRYRIWWGGREGKSGMIDLRASLGFDSTEVGLKQVPELLYHVSVDQMCVEIAHAVGCHGCFQVKEKGE